MKTVLCIPGNWADRTEIVTSIAKSNINQYLFAGMILLDLATKKSFGLEIVEHDAQLTDSFRWAGMVNKVDEEFLDQIKQHTFILYLTGETGSKHSAREIALAGLALLKAGGTGIKVETAGKAFTPQQWTSLTTEPEDANLYPMFVLDSITSENKTTFTCGMHNLGLKDTIISGVDFQEAHELLSTFGYYQVVEDPILQAGQTFSVSENAPIYEIHEESTQPYRGDDLFGNPYGMWRLEPRNKELLPSKPREKAGSWLSRLIGN